jgi:addiction module RelE/StbE family toxin
MAKINWTSNSLEDIETIAEYIAKDSIRYAELQVVELLESVECLEGFPKTGRIVPEVGNNSIRELIVGFYRLIYRIKSDQHIDILTIYHTKRKLTKKEIKKLR